MTAREWKSGSVNHFGGDTSAADLGPRLVLEMDLSCPDMISLSTNLMALHFEKGKRTSLQSS